MKNFKYIFVLLMGLFSFSSCDYLDIVPDERPTEEDAFEDISALQRYMYSCYGYLPLSNSGSGSLDLMTGDEVVTAFEHETFASFPKGNYTSATPVISYWNTIFSGIKQCYILINNVHRVPGASQETKDDYKAQAKFLIAYYHFLLIRSYGPVIVVKNEPDILTAPKDYLGRTNLDECVEFVANLFDEAAENLPSERPVSSYGLATNVMAKALKAKLYVYAASPLFNGNTEFYADFKNPDGSSLMPLTYDAAKWKTAKDALRQAIDIAEQAGHALYVKPDYNAGNKAPLDSVQHALRNTIIDAGNPEIIWAETRDEGLYGIQNKSLPYVSAATWNGIAPTLAMLKRFYTKNGLPIDEDPEFNVDESFNIITVDSLHGDIAAVGEQTFNFNLDREPRYYAWIAFQGGFYEVMNNESNGGYDDDKSYKKYSGKGYGKLVCDFVLGGNCARGKVGNIRQNNYSPTGFLNKKGVNPAFAVKKNLQGPINHPWPILRLADLYLLYAEACVETNDLDEAKKYLNFVRERAGIPSVEDSWAKVSVTLDQAKLREIVRQERMVEFYLENQNFWDMRRWLLAEKYFNVKAQGMNTEAGSLEDFVKTKEVIFERKFTGPMQYLLPIPLGDINKNSKIVNNPGY